MCLTVAGEVAWTWPNRESWRFLDLGAEGKRRGEREEGRHTLIYHVPSADILYGDLGRHTE